MRTIEAHSFDIHRHGKNGTPPPYWTLIKAYDKAGRQIEMFGCSAWAVRTRRATRKSRRRK